MIRAIQTALQLSSKITFLKRVGCLPALLGYLILVPSLHATVTVTGATNGTSLSADTAGVGGTGVFTSLGPITIAEGANGDIPVGANVTLILKAPAGYEFNTAVTPSISFTAARDITAATIAVSSASTLTITLTIGGVAARDTLTIGSTTNLQVRPVAGALAVAGNHIYRPSTGGGTLGTIAGVTTSADGSSGANFGALTEVGGVVTQLAFTTQPAGATAGAPFTTQPVVKTQDQFGNNSTNGLALTNNVTLSLTSGAGPLQGTATLNIGIGTGGGKGTATYSGLRIDAPGSDKQLMATASAQGLTSVLSSVFAVNIGAAAKLVIQTQPSSIAVAGTAFAQQPVVLIEDAGGNVRTNDTLMITAARSSAVGAGTLQGTTAIAAVGGVATFTDLAHLYATNITITFSSGSLTNAVSTPVAISPSDYSQLQVLLPGETATPGTTGSGKTGTPAAEAVGAPFVARVNAVDAYFNVVSTASDTVALTSSDNAAILPGGEILTNGTGAFLVDMMTLGNQTITANDLTDGVTVGNSASFLVNPAPPSQLVIQTQPSASAAAGVLFAQQPVVLVEDQFGNVVTNSSLTVTATRSGGAGTLQGATARAAVAGVVAFTNLSHLVATNITIQFTASGVSGATSAPVTINPGAFSKLLALVPGETNTPGTSPGRAGTLTPQIAGTPFAITVLAVDTNYNRVPGITDTVGITCTDTNAALPGSTPLVDGAAIVSLTVMNATGDPAVTVTDLTDGTKGTNVSSSVPVNPGTYAALQVLAPGESAAPGTPTGKTGTPNAQTTDNSLIFTVNAVDAYWNVVTNGNNVSITLSDTNATPPAAGTLSNGTRTFAVNFTTAGSWTATATDSTAGKTGASSAIAVGVGAYRKLQVLLPGETAVPGASTGKSGTATPQTTDNAFTITVNAVDANFNLINTNSTVTVTSSDPNATLPAAAALVNGSQTFNVQLNTAGTRTVTATAGTKTGATPSMTIAAGAFAGLQLLMPGEAAAAGTVAGKTGAPSARTAGTAFTLTVNAVDARWNLIQTNDVVGFSSSDLNAALPANTALVNGTKIFTTATTFKTAGAQTLTVNDTTDGTKAANTSPSITVNAGAFTKMQLLVPGETAAPGSAAGKTGSPLRETNGTPFSVVVNAVDANWNPVASAPANTIGISSTDTNAILPGSAPLAGGTKTFSLTLNTPGSNTVTAANLSDGTKTSSTSPAIRVTAANVPQTITFGPLSGKTYGDVPFALSATASSGLPVGFSVLSGPASISNSVLTIAGAGTVTVRASQPGDDTYNPATNVDRSLAIAQAALTVVATDTNRTYGATNPVFNGSLSGLKYNDNITATFDTSAMTNSPIGQYAIVPTLTDPAGKLANYILTTNGTLTVLPAPLAINADNASRAYAATNPIFTGSLAGIQNGDNLSIASLSCSATISSTVGSYPIQAALLDPDTKLTNYTVLTNGTLTVTPVLLAVTANDATRTYGAANPAMTGSIVGLVNGDNITATYGTPAIATSPVGPYPITPVLVDPNGRLGNYVVASTNGTLTVTTTALSVAANNASRAFGATNPQLAGVITGIQNGDNITANYACSAVAASPVGTYAITPSLVDPNGKLSNYTVTSSNGTLMVIAAGLSITANNTNRLYGAGNPFFSGVLNGVRNEDNITAAYACVATNNSPVGPYTIVPSLVDPDGKLANYTVSLTNGILTVAPAPLSVTASNATRAYGAANPAFSGTLTGIVDGDGITAFYNCAATTNSGVGAYNIVPSLVDPGGRLGNYAVSATNGTLTVVSAALSVTASNATRAYGSANPVFTGVITGVANADNITAAYACGASSNSAVGPYTITPSLIDPNGKLANYSVNLTNGTLTVTPAGLSIIAGNASRAYGATNPVFGGALSGLLNGDNISATYACSATTNSGVGGYAIIPAPVDPGGRIGNYTVTASNGTLTITAAPLTIGADNASRLVGVTNPAFTGSIAGLRNNDNITESFSTTADTNSLAGNYPIVPALVDPNGRAGNYVVTTNTGILSINLKPTSWASTNGGNAHFYQPILAPSGISWSQAQSNAVAKGGYLATLTSSGEDTFAAGLVSNADYWVIDGGGNSGPWIGGTQPAVSTEPAGGWSWVNGEPFSYTNWAPGFPNDAGGGNANRIQLFSPSNTAAGYWRDLNDTSTALVHAYLIEYDEDPSSTNQTITFGPLDEMTYGDGSVELQATASSGLPVSFAVVSGPATVSGAELTITGAGTVTVRASQSGNANYRHAPEVEQSFVVDQAMLSVVGDDATRVYGTTNPPLTGEVDGLVTGDNIVITWTSAAVPSSHVGGYAVTPIFSDPMGRLGNYSVGFRAGTLSVTTAPLSVQAADKTRAAGFPNPAFTGTMTGLKNNDNITAAYSCSATTNSPVGTYPIIPALIDPQGKLANYSVTISNGTLTVTTFVPPPPALQGLIGAGTTNVTITWSAVSNYNYRVQYKTNLSAPNWTDLTPDVTATSGTAAYTDHPGTTDQRFYRAVLLP